MRSQHSETYWQAEPPFWLRLLKHNLPIVIFLILSFIGMGAVYWYFTPNDNASEAVLAAGLEGSLSAPIFKAVPAKPVAQRLAQSPGPLRIGVIAGHMGSDSGSVCDDGLTEAQINQNIAEKLVANLQLQGIRTQLLEEFDPKLDSYSATAVISIHADSCTYYNDLATGFKIAGSSYTDSSKLSICVEQAYSDATQMPYHENTITPHMTDYHAFREIALGTPAIIIETGFINQDREMLTANADLVTQGLLNGILCYLDQTR